MRSSKLSSGRSVFLLRIPGTQFSLQIHEKDFSVMAIMAIPGVSVSVKQLFFKSCHLCSDLRSSLKAHTIMEPCSRRSGFRMAFSLLNSYSGFFLIISVLKIYTIYYHLQMVTKSFPFGLRQTVNENLTVRALLAPSVIPFLQQPPVTPVISGFRGTVFLAGRA